MPAADEGKHGASEKPSDETEGANEKPSDETISSEAAAEKKTNECTEELVCVPCELPGEGTGKWDLCEKCHAPFDEETFQKSQGICNKCNSKRTKCSRMYGKWPIPAFLQCPPELQLAWWQSEGTTREEIHAKLVTTVSDSKINESVKGDEGPISAAVSVAQKRL